ncbi:MAG: HD domain-containing protein [Deltaproteobacteria bacterium]|nr:HD domain-containing protein [Deltaproteobacteria bacterium]
MSKILAVDNDPFILEFFEDLLSDEGHEVLTAKDGLHAVDVLDAHTPDIIFVDLVMPNIDGKRLCKIIRAMGKLKDVYLVVLSASLEKERKNLQALGVDHFIKKGTLEAMTRDVLLAVQRRKVPQGIVSEPRKHPQGESLAPKSLTEELFSIKKHYEVIFERMSEGIIEISPDNRVIYANPAALSVIGLPEERLLASPVAEIFPHEYRRMVFELIAAMDGSPTRNTEDILVDMNGYQLMVKALAVTDGGGSSIIILNDVTMQKEAEAVLKRRNRELELLNLSGRAFNSSLELDKVLVTVLEELRSLIDVLGSTIWLVEPENENLVCRQAAGICADILNGWRLEPGQGLAGWVGHHGESLNVHDTRIDYRHFKGVDGKTGYEIRSILGVPLISKGKPIGVIQVVDTAPGVFDRTHQTLLEWLAASAAIAIDNARLYQRARDEIRQRKEAEAELDKSLQTLHRTLDGTIQAIILIVETKDPYTAGHQRRVAMLVAAIGKKLGLSKERIDTLRITGLIHDIGKMATPTAILSKPGTLNETEFALIKEHARVGHEILKKVAFPGPVAEIVYQHHERMDGSGYPRGLRGNDILLEARILSVADVVEALSSHRPYRPALGISMALEEIKERKGTYYDPEVVTACLEIFQSGEFRFE